MAPRILGPVVAALLLSSTDGWAQAACDGARPDSLVNALPPIYRECDVTRKAERRGREPALDFNAPRSAYPDARCVRAEFSFVVDSAGNVELATARAGPTNMPAYAAAVGKSLAELQFRPAQLEGRPVRQLVRYERSQALVVRFGARFAPARGNRSPMPIADREPPSGQGC